MATKRRGPGRPRVAENKLARWIDSKGWTRERAAKRLDITVIALNALCRNARRPSLELAFEIEDLTRGAVPARSWLKVPAHRRDK
jgi:DNA-binding XRE family transcriptional regulator